MLSILGTIKLHVNQPLTRCDADKTVCSCNDLRVLLNIIMAMERIAILISKPSENLFLL